MQTKFSIQDGKLVTSNDDVPTIWVFASPDEAERRMLIDRFKIDEHTLSSALDPDEVSRLEFEPEHTAIIFKRPKNYSASDNFLFKVCSTGLFLFKDRLIVVNSEDFPLFEGKQFAKVSSAADVMVKVIYRTIFHFLEHLRVINMVSDSVEQKVSTSMENRHLLNMFTLGKGLVYYLNAIHSNSVVIDRLRNNAAKIGFTQEQLEALDDASIENQQCYKQAEIYSNILSSLMDARVSIVNNNLSVLMKTLNMITLGIMLPTFVVSAFSMNVSIPLQHHPSAFWVIMTLAVSAVAGFLVFWRYKRW